MLCLQACPLSRSIISLSKFHCRSSAGKRSKEGRRNLESFLPASPIPKSRLAPVSVSTADDEKNVIQLPGELRPDVMPKHVAFIIDGHERWAKSRGLTVHHGHKAGTMNLKNLASSCCRLGIKILTLYALSTENFNRPKAEVDFLLGAFEDFIRSDVKELITRSIRFYTDF